MCEGRNQPISIETEKIAIEIYKKNPLLSNVEALTEGIRSLEVNRDAESHARKNGLLYEAALTGNNITMLKAIELSKKELFEALESALVETDNFFIQQYLTKFYGDKK